MPLSRRSFVRAAGLGGVGLLSGDFVAARGREAFAGLDPGAVDAAMQSTDTKRALIKINANENGYGPGANALDAARHALGPVDGRYPGNTKDLTEAVAKTFGVDPANVLIGTGSGELVSGAVSAFTSPTRALVAALPTWESPAVQAQHAKTPVKNINVDADLRLDIAGMLAASKG